MKLHVLCLNDFPIGVYSTEIAAADAAGEDETEREKLQLGLQPMMHYHIHDFHLNRSPRL